MNIMPSLDDSQTQTKAATGQKSCILHFADSRYSA